MTARRDPDLLIQAFLDEGQTELPDRAYDAVRAEIDQTRQRVVTGPWKEPRMTNIARFVIAAAAVLVVAMVGINLIPGQSELGGPGRSPTPRIAANPSPSPTATIGPSPSPMQMSVGSSSTAMAPGTYVAGLPFPLPVKFTVPAGWQGHIPGPNAVWLTTEGQADVGFSLNVTLYADPCHPGEWLLEPSPGPTVEDFAQALVALPGLEATTPTAVNIGGYDGLQLTITAPDSFAGCSSAEGYLLWRLPLGATYEMVPGEKSYLWILDIDGERLVIDAPERPGQTAQERAEVQAILDSIQIEP